MHFIECNFTLFGTCSTAWIEREPCCMSRGRTVADIASGQVENVRRVIEVDLEDGTAQDVTEDIALEVLALFDEPPTGQVREFLEQHCPNALEEYCADMETARPDHVEHGTRFAAYSGAV